MHTVCILIINVLIKLKITYSNAYNFSRNHFSDDDVRCIAIMALIWVYVIASIKGQSRTKAYFL